MLSPGLAPEWILLLVIPGEAQSSFIRTSLEQPLLLLEESAMALRGPLFISQSLVISTNLLAPIFDSCWAKRKPRGNSGSSWELPRLPLGLDLASSGLVPWSPQEHPPILRGFKTSSIMPRSPVDAQTLPHYA